MHSQRSGVSKDDVMPCYKYKVGGRKRNEVEYQPPISLLTYLHPTQTYDENTSSKCNYRQRSTSSSPMSRHFDGLGRSAKKRPQKSFNREVQAAQVDSSQNIVAESRILQMLREAQKRDEAGMRQQNFRHYN